MIQSMSHLPLLIRRLLKDSLFQMERKDLEWILFIQQNYLQKMLGVSNSLVQVQNNNIVCASNTLHNSFKQD